MAAVLSKKESGVRGCRGWGEVVTGQQEVTGYKPYPGQVCSEGRNKSTQSPKWAEGKKIFIQVADVLLLQLISMDKYINKGLLPSEGKIFKNKQVITTQLLENIWLPA